jgi:DNA repair protein RecN (Recombination protein N)
MLFRLYIKDFTIVDELAIQFEPGFQVITGETGAGKSILVGALGLLCGDRGNADLIRAGAAKAVMEAEFKTDYNQEVLEKLNGLNLGDTHHTILIRREISNKGSSRAFINDTPVTLGDLGSISSCLLDLHGQHQHQRLIHPEYHIHYLDAFSHLKPKLEQYAIAYHNFFSAQEELSSLLGRRQSSFEKHDLYQYQIDELSKANLDASELPKLTTERRIMENSEQLFELCNAVAELLYSNEDALINKLTLAIGHLGKIGAIDKQFIEYMQGLESARVTLEETGKFCEQYSSTLEYDPQRLETVRNREAELNWLLKKYQADSVQDLIQLHEKLLKHIAELENYDERIGLLQQTVERNRLELQALALEISALRKKSAKRFEKQLQDLFETVGLKKARFQVQISWQENDQGVIVENGKRYAVNPLGMDLIEFYVGMNVGEPVRPLHKVASGGEISRIMLCLKTLLADSDDIPTLVFDEIDSGISGRYAEIVGKKMQEVARRHQLIVITHLPQIAAQGTTHFAVSKLESDGRTIVEVKILNPDERIENIARLLGGEKITPQAIANARVLLAVTDT